MGTIEIKPTKKNRLINFFISSILLAGVFFDPTSPEFVQIAFLTAIATAAFEVATGVEVIGTLGFGGAFGLGAGGGLAYTATYIGGSIALSAASRALSKELADDQRGESLSGRTRTTRQPIEPRRIVYGKAKVGGTIVFLEETDDNDFLHMVVAIADHEIESFEEIYLDGDKLNLDNNGFDTTSNYGDKVRVKKHLGSDSQTADSDLMSEAPSWTTSHRGRGVAYLYVRLEWDRDTFSGGGIPNVSAVVKGKNDIYDPRDDTNKYTTNPVLCIRDYLLDSRRGLGATSSEINDEIVKASANTCEEQINLDSGGTQNRYDLDGTIKLDQRPMDIIRDMNSAMDGTTVYTNGEYYINAGEYKTPELELDEGDLRSQITVNTKKSRKNTFNRIKGVYVSPENDWQPADFPPITDSTALSNDNGEKRWKDIELPYTTSPAMAQRLAKYDLARNRQQKTIEATFGLRAMDLVVDDVFEFTFDRYGWDKKEFRVQDWSLVVSEGEEGNPTLNVKIIGEETDSSVYDWDPGSDEQAVSNAPESNLPDPSSVSAPTNLQLNSGDDTLFIEPDGSVIPRIEVTWNQPTDNFVTSGGQIEVQFKKSSASEWEKEGFVDGSDTYDFISSVRSGIDYDVRIRSVSTFGFTSSWTTVTNHTVIGKTALPSDVSAFQASQNGESVNLAWNPVTDDDLGGYIIKYGDPEESDYESARTLTEVAAGTVITSQQVPPGDYTFYIKAVDTSGNQSENADTDDLEVINDFDILHKRRYDPEWFDFDTGPNGTDGILESGSWGLEPWGEFTWGASGPSFYRHWTGKLVPADTKNADEYDNYDLFDSFVPTPVNFSGYQGQEHDVGTEVTARLYGDIRGAFGPGDSGEFTPILQVDARSKGEDYDGFENWSVGTKTGRFFKFRLKLDNESGEVAYINLFEEAVDAEERSETGTIDVSASGTTVTFDTPFVNTPFITLSVPSGSAKVANPDQITTIDFVANVFDSDGTQVSASDVEYRAEGV